MVFISFWICFMHLTTQHKYVVHSTVIRVVFHSISTLTEVLRLPDLRQRCIFILVERFISKYSYSSQTIISSCQTINKSKPSWHNQRSAHCIRFTTCHVYYLMLRPLCHNNCPTSRNCTCVTYEHAC